MFTVMLLLLLLCMEAWRGDSPVCEDVWHGRACYLLILMLLVFNCCCVVQGGQDMFKVPTSAFSTTETFTATHGFVICTQPAAAAGQQSRSSSSCSTTSSSGGAVAVVVNNAQRTEQQQQQQATTPVGWSGLLEISR